MHFSWSRLIEAFDGVSNLEDATRLLHDFMSLGLVTKSFQNHRGILEFMKLAEIVHPKVVLEISAGYEGNVGSV